MLKIAIGILLVCVLTLGANALSGMALPAVPWLDEKRLSGRWGLTLKRYGLRLKRALRFIRGPNSLYVPAKPRPGTVRRWMEADSLVLP